MTPDEALALAHNLLDSDLRATNARTPAARDALAKAIDGRRPWAEAWPQGAAHVPGLVAQDFQESVHETIDASWPLCVEHADHALVIEPDLGPDPFWVCEKTGLPVAPVGRL